MVQFLKTFLDRRDTLDEEERLREDRQSVKDTLRASYTLGVPRIRIRRLEESTFLAIVYSGSGNLL